jgi:farnesyl-diphosphate farnesyltransferase
MFRDYTRRIHAKAVPSDPNFLRLSVACGKIEQWCEHHYPSFVLTQGGGQHQLDLADARSHIVLLDQKRDAELQIEKWRQNGNGKAKGGPTVCAPATDAGFPWEMLMYVAGAFAVVLGFSLAAVYCMLLFFADV